MGTVSQSTEMESADIMIFRSKFALISILILKVFKVFAKWLWLRVAVCMRKELKRFRLPGAAWSNIHLFVSVCNLECKMCQPTVLCSVKFEYTQIELLSNTNSKHIYIKMRSGSHGKHIVYWNGSWFKLSTFICICDKIGFLRADDSSL